MDTVFTVPQRVPGTVPSVLQIYPSADTLPNNLLKFYIQFSQSMAVEEAYQHLSLVDKSTGLPVENPFVVMKPELWDHDHKRFTLFFDPGRVKRSVGLNLELGPPLQTGHSYQLIVDQNWSDAKGQALQKDFIKEFNVAVADRNMPQLDDWDVISPPSRSKTPLTLIFPEPMDHALLRRLIEIQDVDGNRVEGIIELGSQEQKWSFFPEIPWKEGPYEIHVSTIIEDVAGNTLRSLFDVDLQTAPPSEVREATAVRVLHFDVLPPPDISSLTDQQ